MQTCRTLALVLWLYYEDWRDNGFKDIGADGVALRPRPSLSRMRRLKNADYGTRMSLLNDYKSGSTAHAERKP